ncbi:hypothetical protein IHE44_0005500 [Lamprotornis superbus]|uniref:Interleukin-17D n=1 Tax=Lamprotornis superbus TaxID=245042 RepID=A0A835TST9_9PASS|nr:hypothetical protein IHE44_0005500 [Lamprotornis superbus]
MQRGRRPARTRSCGERPEELLEQLYGRLAAGMLSAFHHTLQPEPPGRQHNASCPAGARPPADKRVRLPVNLRSASPWAYRISYDPTRYPKYIPEAYCLCKGCLMGIFGEESLHFRSTPVFMPTVILRRTPACAGGRYVYTEDYITIPVGCTCVPEQDKEAESANSSMDKQEVKLLSFEDILQTDRVDLLLRCQNCVAGDFQSLETGIRLHYAEVTENHGPPERKFIEEKLSEDYRIRTNCTGSAKLSQEAWVASYFKQREI